jgi:uncharacterized protein DUF6476
MTNRHVQSGTSTPDFLASQADRVPGSLFSHAQVAWLRRAVYVMSVVLVVGIIVLIGRVLYLVRAAGSGQSQSIAAAAPIIKALPDIRLPLPAGASVTSATADGSRLVVVYSRPGLGDAIAILDLATGQVMSQVHVTAE